MKSLFCRRLCSCFCGKNPAVGQAAGFFAWILFACAQLLHAVGADVLAAVVLDVPAVTAEDAGRLVLLENNGLAVDIDFDSVLLRDVQRATFLTMPVDFIEYNPLISFLHAPVPGQQRMLHGHPLPPQAIPILPSNYVQILNKLIFS